MADAYRSAGSSNNLPQAVIASHQSQNYGVKSERQKFKGMENSEITKNHYIPQLKGMENNKITKKHSPKKYFKYKIFKNLLFYPYFFDKSGMKSHK